MDVRYSPLKMRPQFLRAIHDAVQMGEKVNKTTTLDLVNEIDDRIGSKIVEIVEKHGKSLSFKGLNNYERECLLLVCLFFP